MRIGITYKPDKESYFADKIIVLVSNNTAGEHEANYNYCQIAYVDVYATGLLAGSNRRYLLVYTRII